MTFPAVRSALCATLLAGSLALSAGTARADCNLPAGDAVADLHVDLPFHVAYRDRSPDLDRSGSHVTARSLREGCVRLLVLSLYLPSGLRPREHDIGQLEALLGVADDIVASNAQLRTGSADADGVRVVYATEGSDALAGHLDRIPELVDRGVRMFGLVHAWHNRLADSATDPRPGRGGLTDEGERFVRAVYRAGALVDVSHASDEAFEDVARIARAMNRPLVASHSNARALAEHERNLTDAQLRAIARSGGVVGLAFHGPFVTREYRTATANDVARHAAHMIDVMGPEHVAIGSDIDGLIDPAEGLGTHAGLPKLVRALCRRGIRGERLRALLHENAARVLLR